MPVVIIGFGEIDTATFRARLSAAIMANPAIALTLGVSPDDILAATRMRAEPDVAAELHAIAATLCDLAPEPELFDDDPPWKGVRAPALVTIDDVTRAQEKLLPFDHGARPAGA